MATPTPPEKHPPLLGLAMLHATLRRSGKTDSMLAFHHTKDSLQSHHEDAGVCIAAIST